MNSKPRVLLVVALLALFLALSAVNFVSWAEENSQSVDPLFEIFCNKKNPVEKRIASLNDLLGKCSCQTHLSQKQITDYCLKLFPFMMDEKEDVEIRIVAMKYHSNTLTRLMPEYVSLARSKNAELGDAALKKISQIRDKYIVRSDISELTRLATEALKSDNTKRKEIAVSLIERFYLTVDINLINPLVKFGDKNFIEDALKIVGVYGNKAALSALRECVAKGDTWRVGSPALTAMARIGDESVLPFLAERIQSEDRAVRSDACKAIVLFGEKGAKEIIDVLYTDSDDVNRDLITALGRCGSEDALDTLLEAVQRREVCYWALLALGNFEDEEAADVIHSRLTQLRERPYWEMVFALADTGDDRAIEPLIEMLDCYGSMWRDGAAERLMTLADSSHAERIARKARPAENKTILNTTLLNTLSVIGNEEAAKVLLEMLPEIKKDYEKARIVRTLGHIGSPVALPKLLEMLNECPVTSKELLNLGQLQQELTVAVGRLKGKEGIGKIEQFAKLEDPTVKAAALYAQYLLGDKSKLFELAKLGPGSSTEKHADRTGEGKNQHTTVTFTSKPAYGLVQYLAEINTPESREILVKIVKSDYEETQRGSAILQLGKLEMEEFKPLFVEMLSDYKGNVQVCAAYVLQKYYEQELNRSVVMRALGANLYVTRKKAADCLKEAWGMNYKY